LKFKLFTICFILFTATSVFADSESTVSGQATSSALSQILDTKNTKTVTSSDAQVANAWVGAWTKTRDIGVVRQLVTLASTDQTVDGLGGTFTFEYSEDGISHNGISEARTISDFQTVRDFNLLNAGAYFRVKYEPSRAMTEDSVIITTTLRKQNDGDFVRLADQEIERDNAAFGSIFAYNKSFDPVTGRSVNVSNFNQILTATQIPSSPMTADEEFIGDGWIDTAQIGHFIFLMAGTESFSTVQLQWSDDQSTVAASTTLTNQPVTSPIAYNVYLDIPNIFTSGRYVRTRMVNGDTEQSALQVGIFTIGKDPYTPLIGTQADISLLAEAILTRTIIAGTKPDGTFTNVALTNTGSLQTGDFLTEVAKGDISGHTMVRKFGSNTDVGATSEFISETGAATPFFPTAAVTVEAISGSALDTSSAGTGARTLYIEGVDGNFNVTYDTVNMNGLLATSATTPSFIRVTRAYVVNTGTYRGANIGVITIRQSGVGTTFATISAGSGQTQLSHYVVPADKTYFISQFNFSIKSAKPADLIFWQAPGADDVSAPFVGSKRVIKNMPGVEGNESFPFQPPIRIEEKTDIWWTATVPGAGGGVSVGYSGFLEDEE
jgi:hypothetical protein